MDTVRTRLYNLVDSLRTFAQGDRRRRHRVIGFLREIVVDDKELLKFFDQCDDIHEYQNPLFYNDKWPSLEIETKDDDSIRIHKVLDKYEKDIPIIIEYKDIF